MAAGVGAGAEGSALASGVWAAEETGVCATPEVTQKTVASNTVPRKLFFDSVKTTYVRVPQGSAGCEKTRLDDLLI